MSVMTVATIEQMRRDVLREVADFAATIADDDAVAAYIIVSTAVEAFLDRANSATIRAAKD